MSKSDSGKPGLINRGPVDDDEDETEGQDTEASRTPDDDGGEEPAPDAPTDSVLAQAEQKIESQLTPQNRADYIKIVTAGMKTGLHGGPDSILASVKNSKDPLHDCAAGAISICLILKKQFGGTMPVKAMVPASNTLMIKALDFCNHAGIMKIGAAELAKATHIWANLMFRTLHISGAMLHTAVARVHQIASDPVNLEKMKRAAGVVKDPRASEPTEMPEGNG